MTIREFMSAVGPEFLRDGTMDQDKRQMRNLKRAIKRAGAKASRQRLKRDLLSNPQEAHFSEVDFGRDSSAGLNGMDRDATRRPKEGR